jgi:hypothetical protein
MTAAPLPRPTRAELDDIAARLIGEELLSLAQAARLFPPCRGRRVHPTTLHRWHAEGKRGVRLDAMPGAGKGYVTSRAAVARFLAGVAAAGQGAPDAPDPQTARRRAREARRLDRVWDELIGAR